MTKERKEMCERLLQQLEDVDWVGDGTPSWKSRFDTEHPSKVYGLKVCIGHVELCHASSLRVQAVDHDLEPVSSECLWFNHPATFTSFVVANHLVPVKETYVFEDFPAVVVGAASDWDTHLPTVDWVKRLRQRTREYYRKMIEDESYPDSWKGDASNDS